MRLEKKSPMPRVFRCSCNYELSFGQNTCPYCFKSTPIHNRWWFWVGIVAVVGLLIATYS